MTNSNLPKATEEPRLTVTREAVEKRLKECKKPRGLLRGDFFPELTTNLAHILSVPLTAIINSAFYEESWPDIWKEEAVTTIPKKPSPENLTELRNISCTPLLSKVMEYFALEQLKKEVYPDSNQFGGLSLIHI